MIATKQNSDRQIHRLAAQRQRYATVKRVFFWQVLIGGPVAIATAVLSLMYPEAKGYVAAWGLLVTLGDVLWLTPWQKRFRTSAATIQEAFDCDVLQLPWNELKAGKPPDPELVQEQSAKYAKWAHKMPPLQNWYPPCVDELPIRFGRIVCQRTNCWWDATQRRRYAAYWAWAVSLICIAICVFALSRGSTVENLLLQEIVPFLPLLLIGYRQFTEQRDVAVRLDKLKDHCDTIWKTAMGGGSDEALLAMSRNLQDEILENRRKAPSVLDFIFRRFRDDQETSMDYSAEQYVAEAKKTLDAKSGPEG